MLKPKDVIAAEQNRKEEAKERNAEDKSKARQERGRRRMAFALSHCPDGDTLTGLAERAGLSRSKAKEAIEVLVERGVAGACKVAKGRGSREHDGFKLAPQDGDD